MSRWAILSALACVLIINPAVGVAAGPDYEALKIQRYEPRRPASDFALQDLDGKTVRLADHRGKLLLLFFYTTW